MTESKEAVRIGYIIACREHAPNIQLDMGMSSFGRTAAEAWRRHIRMDGRDQLDFPIYVQRWSDKGYGPVRVRVEIVPPAADPVFRTGERE